MSPFRFFTPETTSVGMLTAILQAHVNYVQDSRLTVDETVSEEIYGEMRIGTSCFGRPYQALMTEFRDFSDDEADEESDDENEDEEMYDDDFGVMNESEIDSFNWCTEAEETSPAYDDYTAMAERYGVGEHEDDWDIVQAENDYKEYLWNLIDEVDAHLESLTPKEQHVVTNNDCLFITAPGYDVSDDENNYGYGPQLNVGIPAETIGMRRDVQSSLDFWAVTMNLDTIPRSQIRHFRALRKAGLAKKGRTTPRTSWKSQRNTRWRIVPTVSMLIQM